MISIFCTAQIIAKYCSYLIRIEIVCTEIDQSLYIFLQVYIDIETISVYLRFWQQIISFFVRTQYSAEFFYSVYFYYRFNHRQYKI